MGNASAFPRFPFHALAIVTISLSLLVPLAACSGKPVKGTAQREDLILATTTSTQDTGLLDVLVPEFEKRFPYRVKTIAVGTGEALAMGARGEADVLLVHAPKAEQEFMLAGYGSGRKPVMHNWFVLVGPRDDLAGASSASGVSTALAAIAEKGQTFVSRGDDSGTHKKELSLWQAAGVKPGGAWYVESGQGMGETLRIADEKAAYTLSDEATYLALKSSLSLQIVSGAGEELKNRYSVIVVNSKKFPRVNRQGAEAFSAFLTSGAGRSLIGAFGEKKYGKALFTPEPL